MSANDGNKTPLTTRITATVAAYLDGAGFKPVETEVPVADGWTADLASFIYPSRTEAHRLRLIKKRHVRGNYFTVDETSFQELAYRTGPLLTALVEVKISRSDFTKDLDRKFRCPHPPAHLCYLAYPTGLLTPDEIPGSWIGLQMAKNGKRLIKRHQLRGLGILHPQHAGQITDLVAAVAIRRAHRTRYRALRDFIRAHRASETQRRRIAMVSQVVTGLVEWLNGEGMYASVDTLPEMLAFAGWTGQLPAHAQRAAAELEAMRRKPEK